MQFKDTAAIVTGGASGLGAATARRLAALGVKVAIFDRDVSRGKDLALSIDGIFHAVDVTSESDVDDAIRDVETVHGKARILVNCAGIGPPARTVDRHGHALPLDQFKRVVEINLFGSFNVASKFASRLHDAERLGEESGVIVNTASVAAYDGQIGQVAYAASKGGIVAMTLPMARDLAKAGVRVMTIAPGLFLTPLLRSLPQEAQDSLGNQVPFPSRLGDPDEYAQLVESIIGNPMLNGETIRLDGAIRMAPK
jgi:NAD(P)-dependent dehydrogenase (short-subunit alcohol dehydrogenase family)